MSRRFVERNEHLPNQWYHPQRSHTYGGNHDGGIERGDDHVSVVGVRPWLQNTMDISPVTRHDKPWTIPPCDTARHNDPNHRIEEPTYYNFSNGRCGYLQR